MVLSDWSLCKNCHFPGLHSAMLDYVSNFSECPMCSFSLSIQDIQKLSVSQATDCLRGKMEALESNTVDDEARTPLAILKRATHQVVTDAPGVINQDAAGLGGLVA